MKVEYIFTLTIVAFLLHLVWENAQAPLYTGYQSFPQHFPMCLASTVGDVVITLLIVALVRLFKKGNVQTTPGFVTFAAIGFAVAVAIEKHALLTGRWNYASAMPIIPRLHVGLTPILQMTVLIPLAYYLATLFDKGRIIKT